MTLETNSGCKIDSELLKDYFRSLINQFFKILPLREMNEPSITVYMESLQMELLGCKELIGSVGNDGLFLSLASILQGLMNNPEADVLIVRREVFKAISVCNRLIAKYARLEAKEVERHESLESV